jgi:RNA polymerase sigma-70 factor (ECF subfamily)
MPPSPPQLVSLSTAEVLLRVSRAPKGWNLTAEQFQIVLERSVARRFSTVTSKSAPAPAAVEKYLALLQVQDLALACACSAGNVAAWEHFVAEYRPQLHRAARAIAGESAAPDLADSLFTELFGLPETPGARRSLFEYFHGRSKLSTWLHAILARRHVDEIRRTRRFDPIEDSDTEGSGGHTLKLSAKNSAPDPDRERYLVMMQAAVEVALDTLDPRDRLRLAYYYVEELTLLEIGNILGEHEATVSRKLERARQEVRRLVEAALREDKKLTEPQLRLCFEYAREEWPFDLTVRLGSGPARAVSPGE